jgi:hypothetical protein
VEGGGQSANRDISKQGVAEIGCRRTELAPDVLCKPCTGYAAVLTLYWTCFDGYAAEQLTQEIARAQHLAVQGKF